MADYEIGRYYRVPAVLVNEWWGYVGWVPVIGPKHEDAEIIGFPGQHFHVNWRFAPREIWKQFGDSPWEGQHFAFPIQCPDSRGAQVIERGPEVRLMKCKRDPGAFPMARAEKRWLPELRAKYACTKLLNGACPHRGIPVSAMHRDGDILTCPGHGLQWNAVTGLPHQPEGKQT